MAETKSVLVLDDEEGIRDAIARGFSESPEYQFDVETAESPEDCIARKIDYRQFDIFVVDLDMEPGVDSFFGFPFIGIRVSEFPEPLIVVYSVHGHNIENVVRAIRRGATDFILKGADCLPHQVAERVVKLLQEIDSEKVRREQIRHLEEIKRAQWQEDYAGKILAIGDEQTILPADTRLQAVVEYRKRRREQPGLPEEPVLLEVPRPE